MTAMVDSKLCFIHKDAVKKLADRYPELALRIKRCSRAETKVHNKTAMPFSAVPYSADGNGRPFAKTGSGQTSNRKLTRKTALLYRR